MDDSTVCLAGCEERCAEKCGYPVDGLRLITDLANMETESPTTIDGFGALRNRPWRQVLTGGMKEPD
jgi:hypothetical protein